MENIQKLSDKDLYAICKKWGAAVLEARRKFAGLLPEVYRREQAAWEKGSSWLQKRKFTCVYEFAARLAGMSRDQVDQVIRIEKRFEDKPILREALVRGEVSVNKLARVVSIVTVENQREILGKVEALSNRALEVFVKDFKNKNGLSEPQNELKSLHVHLTHHAMQSIAPTNKGGLQLDEDIENELLEMQSKNIDVNGMLREFLRGRKEKLAKEKSEVAEKQKQERDDRAGVGFPAKRYVPADVRKLVNEEFGDRCSAPGCKKPAENLHHERGFAKDQCHDPRYLKPLCKGHHELTHAG